ncbi:uncharacterized protein J8A68_001151 [[Candida] subhashii]|uniref:Uncharacterized protein n=1 Tax=[Candida] subhashii TaxID=561895 RepID=A0A8J5UKF6_9ASCO|nr:uncharacterized protein J8A68_001151 [[Candida] subhashii]KAG7665463.1 hypothetical protein J8A68_001151 [[Candida] subhashii]
MSLESLQVTKKPKKIVLVFNEGKSLSIGFNNTDNISIYSITNPFNYKPFIKSLILKHIPNIHIIVSLTNANVIVQLMKFLYQFQQFSKQLQTEFLTKHKNFLQNNQEEELSVRLAIGQCDLPLSFPVTILLDSTQFSHQNQLSPSTILNQQLCRFISLKHGCTVICRSPSNPKIPIEDTVESLIDFQMPPKPIFDDSATNDDIQLYIPSSWDSWNKIIVQGKSIMMNDNNQSSLICDVQQLEQLNSAYDDYFNHDDIDVGTVFAQFNKKQEKEESKKREKLHSLNEILSEIVNPSMVEA